MNYSEVRSLDEAAGFLGVTKQTVIGLIRSGQLSSRKVGNIRVVPKRDIQAVKKWYESNKESLAPVADDTWDLVAIYYDLGDSHE